MADEFDLGELLDEVETEASDPAPTKAELTDAIKESKPKRSYTDALLDGLRSRDAEAGGFPEHFEKGERAILSAARRVPLVQFFGEYLPGVVSDPKRAGKDALGLAVSGPVGQWRAAKGLTEMGAEAFGLGDGPSEPPGDILEQMLENLGRDVAHGGMDPKRPVSSPVGTALAAAPVAGGLQRVAPKTFGSPKPAQTSAPAGKLAKSFHKKGRALQLSDDAMRAKNYAGDRKIAANRILNSVDKKDIAILEALKKDPKNALLSDLKTQRADIKQQLADAVLNMSDDVDQPITSNVRELQQALERLDMKVDAAMVKRAGRDGANASAMGSAKGNQHTFDYKPELKRAQIAAREARELSHLRKKANDAARIDGYGELITPERGGNSMFLQTAANKLKNRLAGATPEQAFARERALRDMSPTPGMSVAAGGRVRKDDALARLLEELGLSPWEE